MCVCFEQTCNTEIQQTEPHLSYGWRQKWPFQILISYALTCCLRSIGQMTEIFFLSLQCRISKLLKWKVHVLTQHLFFTFPDTIWKDPARMNWNDKYTMCAALFCKQILMMASACIHSKPVHVHSQVLVIIIDREAREIMHLVASVRPFVGVCFRALLFEPFDLSPWFLIWGSTLT